ncbi:hypothetical protein SA496_19115 [Pseudomonas sp. JS3066]|jgi:hypothetical protein|uniref:hypothetical protein n=1 Tax=unclassified Pseudomonas TaxID=196821 RepID=UPI000EA86B1C|nr:MULTISPECIES: hypothetical protein [unclassified Pseudomonas]AYF90595.1 hypothetical protein D6Z43_26950 [Pseudomonas sp. DY-1]MDH4651758.1 hypothetical protein [Pseudomonas sp. BN606]MRK22998.1 hypothetical protein [Pseudomonas sp. JG-B]WVK91818.1 hypothetical protein SA496_19115 [Pseudomonas sp. JS3066]
MKSTFSTTTLSGLLLALAVTTGPVTVLAENGSDRLDDYRIRNQQLLQMREDSSESFTRMVQEEPTASGPSYQDDGMRSSGRQMPKYQSLIHQQRVEFGK